MNAKERSVGRIGLILSSVLALAATGCATHVHKRTVYVPQPVVVEPPPPVVVTPSPAPVVLDPPPAPVVVVPPAAAPVVVIQSENDFHEPLSPYGRWVVVPGYGYSWVPARVQADWRPYSDGYWQRTDAGWYWMSDEPWGWATYHYGRWDWNVQFGWFWVPQTQWAPAWVCWREGGGYVGWAPLRPSVTVGVSLTSVNYEPAFASRAYVFVEHRRMLEPVHPKTVIVNNTTIINKTVNITRVNVVNKTVINEGPRPDVIERESGRKIHTVAARDFRHREETAVADRNRNVSRSNERKVQVQTPVHTDAIARRSPAQNSRRDQPAEKSGNAMQPTPNAQPPVTVSPTAPAQPKRVDVARQENRKHETPAAAVRPDRLEAKRSEPPAVRSIPNRPMARTGARPTEVATKPVESSANPMPARRDNSSNAEQVVSPARHLLRTANSDTIKSDSKRGTDDSSRREAKPQPSEVGRPTAPSADTAQRINPQSREKSRSTGRDDSRSDERGKDGKKRDVD